MKIKELVELLEAEIFTTNNYDPDKEVVFAFGCDLMSDALMLLRNVPINYCEDGILVTGLVTVQGVRTAEMLDLGVILLVRGKHPNEQVINAAEDSNVVMIGTKYTMFSASGKMYTAGIKGVSEL